MVYHEITFSNHFIVTLACNGENGASVIPTLYSESLLLHYVTWVRGYDLPQEVAYVILYSTVSHTANYVGETGSNLMGKMFSGFFSYVLQLLCVNSWWLMEFPDVAKNKVNRSGS